MHKSNIFSLVLYNKTRIMSTFERCKRNILRDMAASKTHTADSWARIMLENTARLTNVEDQRKFWEFISNPYDVEDIPAPVVQKMEHIKIDQPRQYTAPAIKHDDEKESKEEVVIVNEYFRNGATLHIRSKPVNTNSSRSLPSLIDLGCAHEDSDEKTSVGNSSGPSEQSV